MAPFFAYLYTITRAIERVKVNGYADAMARPTFTPDDVQRRTLRDLEAVAARLQAADARLTELIAKANDQGVPLEHIAKHGGVTRKTVYRRLGRPQR